MSIITTFRGGTAVEGGELNRIQGINPLTGESVTLLFLQGNTAGIGFNFVGHVLGYFEAGDFNVLRPVVENAELDITISGTQIGYQIAPISWSF